MAQDMGVHSSDDSNFSPWIPPGNKRESIYTHMHACWRAHTCMHRQDWEWGVITHVC